MPTYQYQCANCDYEFEEFQPITAKPMRKCPQCGRNKLRRLIGSGGGLIFKGSGFYCNDYRKSSAAPSTSKPKKEAKAEPCCTPCAAAGSSDCPATKDK